MPRVLVVYHLLPHYRRDVFRELESTEGWEFHFAAGASSRDPGIATMTATDLHHVHVLDNVWLGPFLWQRGLFRLLRQHFPLQPRQKFFLIRQCVSADRLNRFFQ